MTTRAFTFTGGGRGTYRVVRMDTVAGDPLPSVPRVAVSPGLGFAGGESVHWFLRGVTSNLRYTTRAEKTEFDAHAPTFGRPEATCAALIPIRKNAEWWEMTQDERRSFFEGRASHLSIALRHFPSLARRLHHCRDLGTDEPFDFLTWFEYAPADERAFDELVAALRATPEWRYVDREIDIRLVRDGRP